MRTTRDRDGTRGGHATARIPDGLRQAMPLVAWLVALVVAIVAFTAMGSGPLATPPVTEPGAWGQWAAAREPVVATVAVLRLVVLALAWYLVGVTTVGAVARLARIASLVRLADTLSIPVVRRVLQASLGVGLATAVVAASTPGLVSPRPAAAPAAASTDPADLDEPTMQPLADPAPVPPGMRPLPRDEPAPPDPATTHPVTPADTRQRTDEAVADTWTVASGDHLWAIAEAHLRDTLGAAPSDEVVATYWHRLVEANRGRLVDPDDPDLVVPGQRFVLPAVEVPE